MLETEVRERRRTLEILPGGKTDAGEHVRIRARRGSGREAEALVPADDAPHTAPVELLPHAKAVEIGAETIGAAIARLHEAPHDAVDRLLRKVGLEIGVR